MNSAQLAVTYYTFAALAGWYLVAFAIPRFATDSFRQALFELRDKMFDDCARGELSFDDRAYWALRSLMNGSVRFGHRISISLGFLLSMAHRGEKKESEFAVRWRDALSSCSEEKRKIYISYRKQLDLLIVRQMFFNSPLVLATIVAPVGLIVFAGAAFSFLSSKMKVSIRSIELAAFEESEQSAPVCAQG